MPLVMSMRAGQDFYVGDDRVVMGAVRGKLGFDVFVEKSGSTHHITEDEAAEILLDVFVSAGPRPVSGSARVVIEAPPEITILRGDRYREALQ